MSSSRPIRMLRYIGIGFLQIAFVLPYPAVAADPVLYYRMNGGDTIGEVLNELGICPLWSKDRNVARTLLLNHLPNDSAAKKLPIGKVIELPVRQLSIPSEEYKIVNQFVERTITDKREYCKTNYQAPPLVEKPAAEKPVAKAIETPKIQPVSAPVSVAAATPPVSTAVARTPSVEDRAISRIGFAADFNYFSIYSIDKLLGTDSTFLSRLSPGALVYWKLEWNDDFQTKISFHYNHYSVTPFEQYKSIQNTDGSLLGINFAGEYRLLSKLWIGGELGSQETIFNRSLTTSLIKLDTVVLPYAGIGVTYDWVKYRGISLRQNVSGHYFLSQKTPDYQINNGVDYGTSLELSHFFNARESKRIFGTIGYFEHRQDTDFVKQTTRELRYQLGFEFLLNDE